MAVHGREHVGCLQAVAGHVRDDRLVAVPPTGACELREDPELLAELQAAVDSANQAVSRAESIRKFAILDEDFTEAGGQLTPTLKVRRNVVMEQYAVQIAALYGDGAA